MRRFVLAYLLLCVGCADDWCIHKPSVVVNPADDRIVTHEFRCLVIEDVKARASLPPSQLSMLTGKNLRDFLKANCVKDASGNPQYRFVDKSAELTGIWKDLAERYPSTDYPVIILDNAGKGIEKKLPTDWAELKLDLEKYAGVSQ